MDIVQVAFMFGPLLGAAVGWAVRRSGGRARLAEQIASVAAGSASSAAISSSSMVSSGGGPSSTITTRRRAGSVSATFEHGRISCSGGTCQVS